VIKTVKRYALHIPHLREMRNVVNIESQCIILLHISNITRYISST